MEFGDIVINKNAGDKNPSKVLMVVHWGEKIKCLSLNGKEVIFRNDKDLKLKFVSKIDFSKWIKIAKVTSQPLSLK